MMDAPVSVVAEFLRLVQDRRDALGDSAGPADVRFGMLAAELAARQVAAPETDTGRWMSDMLGVPLVGGIQEPHVARQVDAVRWATARLKGGTDDYPGTIRVGLVAARRLVTDPPRVDRDAVRVAWSFAVLGGAKGNALAPDRLTGDEDER